MPLGNPYATRARAISLKRERVAEIKQLDHLVRASG